MNDLAKILQPMKDAGMKSLKGRAPEFAMAREFFETLGVRQERDPSKAMG